MNKTSTIRNWNICALLDEFNLNINNTKPQTIHNNTMEQPIYLLKDFQVKRKKIYLTTINNVPIDKI
jgi:hypothetical protein